MCRTVHVACGDLAAIHFNQRFAISNRDIVSLWDDLSCGPLSAVDDPDRWFTMRRTFWESLAEDPSNPGKRRRRARSPRPFDLIDGQHCLDDASDVVLWLGTGLADQLVLAWMPHWLRAIGGSARTLQVVPFEKTSAGTAIPTVGILSQAELQNHPAPRPITVEDRAHLDGAWSAVIAPDPTALIRFLNGDVIPFPLLHAALARLLWRYPDRRSGLNRFEAQLLTSTRTKGPIAARVIASTMSKFIREDNECVGDNWLFWRLRRLANPNLPHPAVILNGERTTIWGTEVHLTPDGERFLRGEFNFVAMNGINDWIGGVHLDAGARNIWFHHDGTLVPGLAAH